ncbi:hypothetical protein SK128_027025, partial [Halocaridina rubra]
MGRNIPARYFVRATIQHTYLAPLRCVHWLGGEPIGPWLLALSQESRRRAGTIRSLAHTHTHTKSGQGAGHQATGPRPLPPRTHSLVATFQSHQECPPTY